MPILKIFVSKEHAAQILDRARLIEAYDAFIVVEADAEAALAIAREAYPLEDISDQYKIPFVGKSIDPLASTAPLGARSSKRRSTPLVSSPPDAKQHHYIVQFVGPVKRAWVSSLTRAGGTVRQPFAGFAYVVRANQRAVAKIRALKSVRWVGHLPHADRIARALRDVKAKDDLPVAPRRKVVPGTLTVEAFSSEDVGRIARAASKLGFRVLSQDPKAQLLVVLGAEKKAEQSKQVRALSAVHGVRYLRERTVRRTSNDVATGLMGNAYAALRASGPKLSGKGEVIAVCDTGLDTGDPNDIHPDFAGRVQALKSYPISSDWMSYVLNSGGDDGPADLDSGHGTHVAGSVLGNGSAAADTGASIRGLAHEAKLVFQAIEQEMKWKSSAPALLKAERYILSGIPLNLTPLFQYAYDQGARVHSNSWGGGDPGSYDDQCSQFDSFVWKRKDFCFVIAAGNDGSDAEGDGQINLGSVSSPGTAKNCITVGASENLRTNFNSERYGDWWPDDFPVAPFAADAMANNAEQIVAFSSRGPTKDGRIKPEVVAPGTFILSTRSSRLAPNNFAWAAYPPNKRYFHMGGTSMATPLVAGAVALLRQFLRTKHGIAAPSAALLKALLVAGAKRLRSSAPGKPVLDNDQGFGRVDVSRSVRRIRLIVEGPALETGQQSTGTFKVTSTGTTLRIVLAYSDFPGRNLVNNLNLIVTDPAGKQHTGNESLGSVPLATDVRNNLELVQVTNAKKGVWSYRVVASNVPHGPQDFALAAVVV